MTDTIYCGESLAQAEAEKVLEPCAEHGGAVSGILVQEKAQNVSEDRREEWATTATVELLARLPSTPCQNSPGFGLFIWL